MFFNLRAIVAFVAFALVAAAAPSAELASRHAHAHEDGVTLATRADGVKVAVVTCMDPRIEVDFLLEQLKLTSTNSYIIRNAGGRTKEALRSIIMSQEYLGTSEVYVIHHTECGMADKSEESIRHRFYKKDDLARTFMVNEMSFLPIRTQNFTESVLDDVALVEYHPLIKSGVKVTGWIYNVAVDGKDSVKQVYP